MQTKENKPILHLICGLPGSGKTTLSKKIADTLGAIRFCPDEWIKKIWPKETAETEGNSRRDQIEQLHWKLGKEFLKLGKDVVIEPQKCAILSKKSFKIVVITANFAYNDFSL